MNTNMDPNDIQKTIRSSHRLSIENRQITRRLKNLRLNLLKQTKDKLRQQCKKGEIERRALNDPAYLEFLQQIVDTDHGFLKHRILYETHLMLFRARQSLRKHSRRM